MFLDQCGPLKVGTAPGARLEGDVSQTELVEMDGAREPARGKIDVIEPFPTSL
jgi:hypothetical protein